MSGLVGHSLYALLAAKAADERQLSVAPVLRRNLASYLAGAYLGCDIQVMPEAICQDTGREVGFGTAPLARSPITGGEVRPWFLVHDGKKHRPNEIHRLLYGRSHLIFGWAEEEKALAVPWDHLHDYCALVVRDLLDGSDRQERSLAYLFGWMVHIVGDSLIKSVRPGIKMQLLDGTYTPRNRPIQDLFAFHKVGIEELQLNWEAVFRDMAATPIEPIQLHYMRVGERKGRLGEAFSDGWRADRQALLGAVLKENRRWLAHHAADVLDAVRLTQDDDGPHLSRVVKSVVGDLDYSQMMAMAERSGMRQTLAAITGECITLFEHVIAQVPQAKTWRAGGEAPGWSDAMRRWRL